MAPRDLRRRPAAARHAHVGEHLTLRLGYRPPYDLESMLGFLRGRALPGGEHVGDDSYARVIAGDGEGAPTGWLRVSPWPGGEQALKRSEERRVGKECGCKCRDVWGPENEEKKKKETQR